MNYISGTAFILSVIAIIASFTGGGGIQFGAALATSTTASAIDAAAFAVNGITVFDRNSDLYTATGTFSGQLAVTGAATFASTLTVTGRTVVELFDLGGATSTIAVGAENILAAKVCDNTYLTYTPTASSVTMYLPPGADLIADCLSVQGREHTVTIENGSVIGNTVTMAASGSEMNIFEPVGGDLTFIDVEAALITCKNIDGTNVNCVVTVIQPG